MMWSPVRFYRESRSYTRGCYTNWHFWRMFPIALVKFYCWYPAVDFYRIRRMKRILAREASE